MPDQSLEFRTASVVVKRTHIEFRRRGIENTYAKSAFIQLWIKFSDRDAMACLFVREKFPVDQSSVGIDFIEFTIVEQCPNKPLVLVTQEAQIPYRLTILSA